MPIRAFIKLPTRVIPEKEGAKGPIWYIYDTLISQNHENSYFLIYNNKTNIDVYTNNVGLKKTSHKMVIIIIGLWLVCGV